MKKGDSGKSYHVKKAQGTKKKRRKDLKKQIKERRKKGLDTTTLEIMLMLES